MQTTQTGISNKAIMVIALVRKAILNSPTRVSFLSLKNYKNSQGEVSNNLINIGINYGKSKLQDIETLRNLDVTTLKDVKSKVIDLEKAKVELITAFEKPDANRSKGQTDAYTIISDGIKVHNETGVLYLYGYRVSKNVIVEGEYKAVNSSALTIAKNELRKLLKTGKFKQYSLEVGNELTAKGETIEL